MLLRMSHAEKNVFKECPTHVLLDLSQENYRLVHYFNSLTINVIHAHLSSIVARIIRLPQEKASQ